MTDERPRTRFSLLPAALGLAACAAGVLTFALLALELALRKVFTIDEFQYAHASWAIARGQVPYRDFFEPHFPFVYQSLSLLWHFSNDDPRFIVGLRVGMLVFLVLACVAAALLAGMRPHWAGLLGPLFLLQCQPFLIYATEIRNDPGAFALYVAALAALVPSRAPRARSVMSGAFLAMACWATQKAFLYGFPFFAALVMDLAVHARKGQRCMLGSPKHFLLGVAIVVLPIAIYLSATSSWDDWWRWTIEWAKDYQLRYRAFSWMAAFDVLVQDNWWLLPAAAVGVASIVRRELRAAPDDRRPVDQLLVASLFTTFISVSTQQAPWAYSLVPFIGVLCILAARGVIELVEAVPASGALSRGYVALTVALALVLLLGRTDDKLNDLLEKRTNEYQLDILGQLHELTGRRDVAYDNSGSYVSRPHAYFFFETFEDIRTQEAERLTAEIPEALMESGCVVVMNDVRDSTLPRPVKRYLAENYQPYNADIFLFGRQLRRGIQRIEVPKKGRYFFEPADAVGAGAVFVDGQLVEDVEIALSKGPHRIEIVGEVRAPSLLWLPKNKEHWRPRRGLKGQFSVLLL